VLISCNKQRETHTHTEREKERQKAGQREDRLIKVSTVTNERESSVGDGQTADTEVDGV